MTVHIALANGQRGVLLSDSQGTSANSESHGIHKQFVGFDFAVGVAGYTPIITRLFDLLLVRFAADKSASIDDVSKQIEEFYQDDVRPDFWARTEVLLLGAANEKVAVRHFEPGTFKTFGPAGEFGCIGTGAEFVNRAIASNNKLGNDLPQDSLVDMLVAASYFADAACESISVDDLLAVVMLVDSRTYLLGDVKLQVRHAPASVRERWSKLARHWDEFQATIQACSNESLEAQRLFSKIHSGKLEAVDTEQLLRSSVGIASQRKRLDEQITEFRKEYDQLLNEVDDQPLPNGDPV